MQPATDLTQVRADIHLHDPALDDLHKTIMLLTYRWAENKITMDDYDTWLKGRVEGSILAWRGISNVLCVPGDLLEEIWDEYYAMLD